MSLRSLRRRAVRGFSRLAWPLLELVLRLLIRSWRIRLLDESGTFDALPERGEPVILAFWHSNLLPCGAALHRRLSHRGYVVTGLVSRSGDGEIVARAAAGFGFRTIRGSTSRGGLAALRNLYRELEAGRTIAVAPDGPRGPARIAQEGIVQAAALSGAAIVPMAAAARRSWRVRSWDRTLIPKPFTEVLVAVGEGVRLERGRDLRSEAVRLQEVLDDLSARAEAAAQSSGAGGEPK